MNATPKIFGREPAVVGGVIEAALALLISFGLLGFIGINGAEGESVVMAVVFALIGTYVAWVTKDTLLGVLTTLLKASIALLAYYHYSLSEEQITTLLAIVPVLLGFFHRTQTGVALLPSLNLGQHTVEIPPDAEATDKV